MANIKHVFQTVKSLILSFPVFAQTFGNLSVMFKQNTSSRLIFKPCYSRQNKTLTTHLDRLSVGLATTD